MASSKELCVFTLWETTPGSAEQIRNEGVGNFLNEEASAAWRKAGETWKPVNSRTLTAKYKWDRRKHVKGKVRGSSDICVCILCVYAPTARAPCSVKSKGFFFNLQDILDKIHRIVCSFFLVMLVLEKVHVHRERMKLLGKI